MNILNVRFNQIYIKTYIFIIVDFCRFFEEHQSIFAISGQELLETSGYL